MDSGRVTIEGISFAFRVERSPRRTTIGLVVPEAGEISVRAPLRTVVDAAAVIRRHRAWILRRHQALIEQSLSRPRLADGGWVWLLGEQRTLASPLPNWGAYVGGPFSPDASDFGERLTQWYRHGAEAYFTERLALFAGRAGADFRGLRISEAKTRWGYCRADGWIGINWRLMQAPQWVGDYVVVHELIHRHHPNHQAAFWQAVGRVHAQPDAAQTWLKQHGPALFW